MTKTSINKCVKWGFVASAAMTLAIGLDRSADAATADSVADTNLEEIVVTAQKREERLQDVPVPVTALSPESLIGSNQVRIEDYYTSVPGLTLNNDTGSGESTLSIRGLSSGGGNPTVGITVDDVPVGSSTSLGYGGIVPDLDPADLARIEVLRGPQGTIYGASSIGGLLKFVTLDPSTDRVSGYMESGIDGVYNGIAPGYNFRAGVNVPLGNTMAIRASGFTREDPGYIDNIVTGQRGVNRVVVDGGLLTALWRPSEDFSIKLGAMLQDTASHGSQYVEVGPGLGDLQQDNLRGTGLYDRRTQLYSATVTAKLGPVNLTSITGYSSNKLYEAVDYGPALGYFTKQDFDVTGTPLFLNNKNYKFTQELRLSGSIWQSVDWLFGAFYTQEDTPTVDSIFAENAFTGAIVGAWLNPDSYPTTYDEYAAFTDITYHISDRFDIQLGGRESVNRQTYQESFTGEYGPYLLGVPSPVIQPRVVTNDNSFTYLVTPRFKISSDWMAYARLASGYRPGGPNPTCVVFNLPCSFKPDTTKNYEIGVKGDVRDHTLSFDGSVYYIDWKDIQLSLVENGAQLFANASSAKSQGVELSVDERPLKGLTITGWVAISDAKLTGTFPPDSGAYGVPGNSLPYSNRFSGTLSLQQDFPLGSSITGFVGGAVNYVGNRYGLFTATSARQDLPAYARTDIRAGGKYDSWTLHFFVTNLTDRRGLLGGGVGTLNPVAFDYIQPRTIGANFAKTF